MNSSIGIYINQRFNVIQDSGNASYGFDQLQQQQQNLFWYLKKKKRATFFAANAIFFKMNLKESSLVQIF